MTAVGPALALALAAGCVTLVDPPATDVTLTLCPDEATPACARIADGATPLVLRIAVAAPLPHDALKVKLRASAGAFVAPTDPTHPAELEVALVRSAAAYATLVPPARPGVIRIDTDAAGVLGAAFFALAARPVDAIAVTRTPERLPADATPTAVVVTALGSGGAPLSAGTTVRLALAEPSPATAYFQIVPDRLELDAMGRAQATLSKDATGRAVTLVVTAQPPAIPGGAAPASLVRSFLFTAP